MKKIIISAIALSLCACSSITGSAMKRLSPGMSKDQALKITGKPDGYSSTGNVETYTFTDRPIDMNSPNRADYVVTFTGGKLTSWGADTVRKPSVGMIGVVGLGGVN